MANNNNRMTDSLNAHDADAYQFDQVLKKLETTKQQKQYRQAKQKKQQSQKQKKYHHRRHPSSSTMSNECRRNSDSSDNSSREGYGSSNGSAFGYESGLGVGGIDGREDERSSNSSKSNEQQIFETRQLYVDRRAADVGSASNSVNSFIERARSAEKCSVSDDGELESFGERDATFFEEGLPDAILKLDRRHDIPAMRHENDVLVQIEASTVDRRTLMFRPGVRCNTSLPQGVETTGLDCIGRVVQISTRARAVYGINIDDRIAAIYPFEYKAGYKERGRRNNKYALVDAGYAVTVPKHVDSAEAACMIRLYVSAFQSILKGISGVHTDRYGVDQLKGQSILIQNGETELGRVLIELASLLGASQIYATGPTECHPLLVELGAIPLGARTFSWELFLEERISLVLVQEIPTEDNFEQLISVLNENKGVLVYIYHDGHKIDEDELGSVANEISCDGIHFQELAKKAQNAMNSAKFSLRLACSPKYMVYEGVWPSCKEDPNQFKEDLRYLLTLLEQESLKPNIFKCIDLEEVSEVQDTIELLGKKGTVVCLPTALYEKKACHVVPPEISLKKDEYGFLVMRDTQNGHGVEDTTDFDYAIDAGYGTAAQYGDTLSDFHRMRDKLSCEEEASCHSSPNYATADERVRYDFGGYSLDEQDATNYQTSVQSVPDFIVEDNAAQVASMSQTSVTNSHRERSHSFQNQMKTSRRYKSYKAYQQQRKEKMPSHQDIENERHEGRESIVSSPYDERNDARKMRREARKSKLSNVEGTSEQAEPDRGPTKNTSVVNKVDADEDKTKSAQYRASDTPDFVKQSFGSSQKLPTHPSWKVKSEVKNVHSDSRNEDESGGEETSLSSNDVSSFYMIMNKWKNSDVLSQQSEKSLPKKEKQRM